MEEKQVTVKGGRKRKNLVKFYLNDEAEVLALVAPEGCCIFAQLLIFLIVQIELNEVLALAPAYNLYLLFFHLNCPPYFFKILLRISKYGGMGFSPPFAFCVHKCSACQEKQTDYKSVSF